MKLASQSLPLTDPANPLSVAPLFSYSYELLFPQPLSFDINLNPQGCGSQPSRVHTHNPANPLFPITSLQDKRFHEVTHSFAQRRTTIYPILNSFRTLSIATGVVPLGGANISTSTSTSSATRREPRIARMRCSQHSVRPDAPASQTCQHPATVLKSTRHRYDHR